MQIYLVHQGESKPEEIDPERSLTESGTRAIQKVANFLRTSGGVRTANLGDAALAWFPLALIRPQELETAFALRSGHFHSHFQIESRDFAGLMRLKQPGATKSLYEFVSRLVNRTDIPVTHHRHRTSAGAGRKIGGPVKSHRRASSLRR